MKNQFIYFYLCVLFLSGCSAFGARVETDLGNGGANLEPSVYA